MGQDRSSASSHQQVQRLAPPRKGLNPARGPPTKTCHGFGGNHAGDAVNQAAVNHAGDAVNHAGNAADHAGDDSNHVGDLQQATEDDLSCAESSIFWKDPGGRRGRTIWAPQTSTSSSSSSSLPTSPPHPVPTRGTFSPTLPKPLGRGTQSPQDEAPKALRTRQPKPSGRGIQALRRTRHPSPQDEAPKPYRHPGVMGMHDEYTQTKTPLSEKPVLKLRTSQ